MFKKNRPTQKHQVHNLIILDESGSMDSIKSFIIKGFNEVVQTVKGVAVQYPEQEHLISFVTFNGLGIKTILFKEPVEKLNEIDANKYKPDSMTPLYDAMGFSFAKLKKELAKVKDYNVLVTILTDGEENASKEFSGKAIKQMIDELKKNRWTFTYIGADHDVEKFAATINITNVMTFSKNAEDIDYMFAKEKMAREIYSKKIRNQEATEDDFYEEDK